MTDAGPGFGVYVHWPFCRSKCPYCDFNSHVRASVDQAAWQDALKQEIAFMADLAPGREVASIFFGGGTPSLMEPATVETVIEAVVRHWRVAGDVEITLEANPGSSETARFTCYRAAGVNRVSIGAQAFDDASLKALGRGHDGAGAKAAIALGRKIFDRLSFDLIYGRMGQTCEDWQGELGEACTLGADHLSLYQLTIEPGTRFATLAARGELELPSEDERADMRDITLALTTQAGLPAYEVSNHASPGQECRHNLVYWRSGEWTGVGPGACGRLDEAPGTSIERRQARRPETWLSLVGENGHGITETETVSGTDRLEEVLMMGLRLTGGLSGDELVRAAGSDWQDGIDVSALETLVDGGFLVRQNGGLRATTQGLAVLNAILGRLVETGGQSARST